MSNRGVGRRPDRKPPGEGAGGCGGGVVHGMQGRRGGGEGCSGGIQTVPPSDLVSGVHPSPVAHATMPTPSERSLQPESAPPMTVQDTSSSVSAELLSGGVKQLTLQSQPPKELSPAPAGQVPPSTTKHVRFPDRPGFGTYGHKCVVRANYFLVQLADRDLYQYDVSITPEITSKAVNRKVIKQLVDLYSKSHFGGRKPAYDGRKNLYTAGSLPFSSKEFVIKLVDKVAGGGSKRRDKEFKVAIKFASNTDLHHLQQFLRSRQLDAPQETIQVLDVVLREKPSRDFTAVGRSFFHPQLGSNGELGNGVEYWSGYYQSLRPTQMGLCLNIDVSARSFYEPVKVLEFIVKYLNLRGLTGPLSDQDRVKVKKALKGIHVQLAHNAMHHKISSISTLPTSQLMFPLDDGGKQISVVQYFSNRYNIVLQYPFLPALQAGTASKPIYVPMEICSIVEGQRYIKKLNERQVTAMLKATCQRPQVREKCIMQIAGNNGYNTDELVKKEFGIDVSTNLASLNARVLPPPMLKYHDTGREARVDPRVGQWNMINKKMVNGAAIQSWACVNFSSRLRPDIASQFFHELVGMCESKGMVFGRNPLVPMRSADPRQIETSLLNVHTQCNATGRQLELLIIILPDITGSYGRIKRVCETELGIVSQCCQPSKAAKLSKQYLENVALKINVKAGGRNSVLVDAIQRKLPIDADRPTIVFGADVTHPAPGEDSSPSIAAVVASMDWPEITKYRGLVSAQGHREEIISDLYKLIEDPQRGAVHGGMIREHLIAFYKSTGHKPHRIIFYRDGVSEGQFNQVLLYEMDAIRKACASLEEKYMPPVTFVVVQKRHHTRLFPADYRSRDLTDKSGNILPGTVVDATICHPIQFDFYLNSHAGIQGTSRPTHYHVLFDENRFSADALQILTNHLCYTYARCTRSVSTVPPAYYAHLVAFRARCYIEGEISESGSTSAGGQNTREGNVNVWTLPMIKDNVKDVMFYC